MATFYVTFSRSHVEHHWLGRKTPAGGGMVVVEAPSQERAEEAVWAQFNSKWAFIYKHLEDVHELDRFELGRITVPSREPNQQEENSR